MSDREAMDYIHDILDGREWDSDTLSEVVEILRETGRDVRDLGDE
jgi:hypothetical protein